MGGSGLSWMRSTRELVGLRVSTDEWDILYRLRLQIERDLLLGAKPGTDFPTNKAEPVSADVRTRADSIAFGA